MGGVIWAYMGPKEHMPPPPKFEWAAVPATHRHVTKNIQECNWLQALEGGIDSAHATILHRTLRVDTPHAGLRVDSPHVQGKPPELEVDITDYGYRYAGIRSLGDEGNHVRAYHFVMPFHQIRASQRGYRGQAGPVGFLASGHMWVPMDDHNVMVWNWDLSYDEPIEEQERVDMDRGYGRGPEHMLTDFRTRVNRDNNWMIDRSVQKTETFSGIDGVNAQGRGGAGKHGPHRRPFPGEPLTHGHGHHLRAEAVVAGGTLGGRGRYAARRRRQLLHAAAVAGDPAGGRGLA